MKRLVRILILAGVFLAAAVLPNPGRTVSAQDDRPVLVMTLDGPLSVTWVEYLNRAIRTAQQQDAEAIVIQLNTPGGELTLMNRLVTIMRGSPIPLVVYVSPRGAMAASAGTILTLAGHAAAMAPETVIGAASPVGGQGEDLGEAMESKIKNDMKATVRSLASHRGPEAVALAESTIETAEAVSSQEALEIGLIDFIANDLDDLLQQLDGFQVVTVEGERVLSTASSETIPVNSTFIEQLLATLVNPNIVFLLLTIGVQAILIELSSPGGWLAGFIGVVCLSLAVYGLGILPVNWFGILFLIIAFVLFIVDIKAPTHGALTAAGVGSFIVGALVLFNSPNVPSFQRVSVPLVVGTALVTAAVFFTVLTFGIRAQRSRVRTGQEALTGRHGIARSPLCPEGLVQVAGELWSAEVVPGEGAIPEGAPVEVVAVEGIHLRVRKAR